MIDRFETEQSLPWRESQGEFIAWLSESVYPALAQASRAQLRASLLHYYRRVGLSPHQIPYASDAPTPKLKRTAVTRRGNTSAGRKKGIREKDWRALIQTLAGDPSVYAQIAGAMLVASRAFGLRPSEWFDERTRFVDGGGRLPRCKQPTGSTGKARAASRPDRSARPER